MLASIETTETKVESDVCLRPYVKSLDVDCDFYQNVYCETTVKYEINVSFSGYEEITTEKVFEKAMLCLIEQLKKQNFELPVYVECPEENKKEVDVEEKKKYYNPTNVELYLLGYILSDKSLVEEIKGRLNDTSKINFSELAKKLAAKYEENKP